MPSPSTSLATLRPDLAASLQEFSLMSDRLGFIGSLILPVIETQVQAGTFGRIPVEELLRTREVNRASKAGYNRGDWNFTDDVFATNDRGWEEQVDDRNAAIYADYFAAEVIAAEICLDAVLRSMEKRIADMIFNSTTWTGASLTTGITHEWDDATNAVPITNVRDAKFKVYDNCGLWPDTVIINRKVFENLRLCTQIRDAISSSGAGESSSPGKITVNQIAQALNVEKLLVAGGSQNTAIEGQVASISQIWSGEYAMVCKTADTSNIQEPCIGRIFHWGKDGSTIGGTFETYRDEAVRGDIVRCRNEVQEKTLYVEAGHLLSNITT